MSNLSIQRLLGHKHLGTTMVYPHLARGHLTGNTSPLDLLEGVDTAGRQHVSVQPSRR